MSLVAGLSEILLPASLRSAQRDRKQLGTCDGFVAVTCESQAVGIREIRVKRGAVGESIELNLVRSPLGAVAHRALYDLASMVWNERENAILIRG